MVGFPFLVMERHSLKGKQCLGDEMAEEMREQGISERNLPTGRQTNSLRHWLNEQGLVI